MEFSSEDIKEINKNRNMTARKRHLKEIEDLKKAMQATTSPYLIKDYKKAIQRKERELREFDKLRKDVAPCRYEVR